MQVQQISYSITSTDSILAGSTGGGPLFDIIGEGPEGTFDILLESLPFTGPGYLTTNVNNAFFELSIQVLVTGTANYTVEINLGKFVDDLSMQNNPDYGNVIPDPDGWVAPYPSLTNASTSQIVKAIYPCYFYRLIVNSGTTPFDVVLRLVQQGIC
jgi:hypothetical protein